MVITASSALKTEIDYYFAHKREWLEQYRGQFVLIKGERLLGAYPTFGAAYEAGLNELGNVAMLVHELLDEEPTIQLPVIVLQSQ